MNKKTNSLYQNIFEDLRVKIESGELAAGSRLPTEPELAAHYGVSRVTVARALQQLKELNLIVRIKKSGTFILDKHEKTSGLTIPLLLPDVEDGGSNIIAILQMEAERYRCKIPVYSAYGKAWREREILYQLLNTNPDGLLVHPSSIEVNKEIFEEIQERGIPLVFIDFKPDGIDAPLVSCDNFGGMYNIVRRCVELGHRRIGFFAAGHGMLPPERERLKGYCCALIDSNIPLDSRYIFSFRTYARGDDLATAQTTQSEFLFADSQSFIDEFFSMKDAPTVICCNSDVHAIYLMNLMKRRGISIPHDICITGFDNLAGCDAVTPTLTSVKQDFDKIAKTALTTVFDLREYQGLATDIVMPTEIVERESLVQLSSEETDKANKLSN